MAPHPVGDRGARQRFIARSIWFTVPGTPAVLPYAAVCLHIAAARFFEGAHDPWLAPKVSG